MSARQHDLFGFVGADNDGHTNEADRRLTVAATWAGWYRALDSVHNEKTHGEILDSLLSAGFRAVYEDVVMPLEAAIGRDPHDWQEFGCIIRHRARDARRRGLIKEDKAPRKSKRAEREAESGDLFAGVA